MEATTIKAQPRETGSKAAKQIRKNEHVPCVLYGRNTESTPFQIDALDLTRLIFGRGTNVVEIDLDGQSWNCILKEYDLHPVTDRPLHADFQVLEEGQRLTLTVPLRFQGIPEGQKNGGDTQYILREVTISCLPSRIPNEIAVNVADLEIGDSIHVYDLPQDYEYKMASGQTVVTVVAPRLEAVAADEEEELEDEELAEDGEAVDAAADEGDTPSEGKADTSGDL